MDTDGVAALIATLREEGSDTTTIEAKTAAGGFPTDLARTLSAFSNTPGGGVVVLGIEEHAGFAARGVYDVVDAQKRLATLARQAIRPPAHVVVSTHVVDGARLVVGEVIEAPASMKPLRVSSTGKAYLRAYDGDYELSELEVQAFIANRDHPRFDRQAVPGAQVDDLDPSLLAMYVDTCRASSTMLARFDDDEILVRTGVVAADGGPTLAGLLALGLYPQQYVPNLVIQASVAPRPDDPPGTRASDARKFDGPLPVMLEEAVRWVRRNTRSRVRFGEDGHGRDEPEYPDTVVRELISNALVHRDLGPHAMPYPVTLVLEPNQLVIANPGGLWGITVDRLGRERISSARNDSLLRISQNVRTTDGRRVVEALASGIPAVLESLAAAGMVPPAFYDQGIRFTVRVPNHALLSPDDLAWLVARAGDLPLSDTQRHALVAMRHGRRWTNKTFRSEYPRDSTAARADLQGLVDAGLAVAEGERGGRTYSLAPQVEGGRKVQADLFTAWGTAPEDRPPPPPKPRSRGKRETNSARILDELRAGPMTAADIVERTGLSQRMVKYALGPLRDRGVVVLEGRRGDRTSTYRLADALDERTTS